MAFDPTSKKNTGPYRMRQAMRWYGPGDAIALRDIAQAGAAEVVTALHQVPVGEVWSMGDIAARQQMVREAGLEWFVVESLPVHGDIKRKKGNYPALIENYKRSMEHLARCGLEVITYNFMPVLDWIRTDHFHRNPDGTRALRFDWTAFVYFDVRLLQRPGAEQAYDKDQLAAALAYGKGLSPQEETLLFQSVLLGLPGSKGHFTKAQVLEQLETYRGTDAAALRENLLYFLGEIVPVAERLGLKLALHPDDPPFPVLGLPRVVSDKNDLDRIFRAVPSPANGLCYCTGSLGAKSGADLLGLIDAHGERIHFLHLRNVIREGYRDFRESEHLRGDHPMGAIMERLFALMQQRKTALPMRPDHGFLHSFEGQGEQYPGYSLIGRLKALAELRGLEMGIAQACGKK